GSKYESGRSSTLLKVKTFHDAEARVIGYVPGEGKHAGRLGSLAVQLPNGVQFYIGTGLSHAQREHPPAIGTVITFRYQELTDSGTPRFPSYVGIRRDEEETPAPTTPAVQLKSAAKVVVPADAPGSAPRRF